jgi:hypothetical protein
MLFGFDEDFGYIVIDIRKNQSWMSFEQEEKEFFCRPSRPFSQFKLAQTGKSSRENDIFYLSYFELFGNVQVEE